MCSTSLMRVMGVDPGLTRCGVGIVEGERGKPLTMVAAGVIRTSKDLDVGARLVELESGLLEWMARYAPTAFAVERVFSQHNLASVTDTAQAAGTALLVASRAGLVPAQYTPSEVKAAITGSGRADKAQVGAMVARICRLAGPPKPADAADAVALAATHLWRGGALNRYAQAVAKARSTS